MHVTFAETRNRLPDKLGLLLQVRDRLAPAIAHAGLHPADQLIDHGRKLSFIGHASFDALRDQLLHRATTLAVPVSAASLHRADRTHAAIHLIGPCLVQFRLPRRFIRACQKSSEHYRGGACGQGFCDIARELDPAVCNNRNALARENLCAIGNRRQLRHPGAGHDTGGTDRTGPDSHLHGIDTGPKEILRRLGCRNIPGDQFELRIPPLDHLDRIQHRLRMAVGRIDHDHIHPGLLQARHAIFRIRPDPDRRADAEPAMLILAGVGIHDALFNVLDRNEPLKLKVLIHDRKLLDPVFVQHLARLFQARAFRRRNQLVSLHDLRDLQIHPGFESQVSVGQNADQLLALRDRNTGDPVFRHQRMGIANRLIRRDRNRIEDHAALGFLDPVHFRRLIRRRQDAVDNSQPAFASNGDGQAGLRHGIHSRADNGDIDLDIARERRPRIDFTRQHLRLGRNQYDIVVGQP